LKDRLYVFDQTLIQDVLHGKELNQPNMVIFHRYHPIFSVYRATADGIVDVPWSNLFETEKYKTWIQHHEAGTR